MIVVTFEGLCWELFSENFRDAFGKGITTTTWDILRIYRREARVGDGQDS